MASMVLVNNLGDYSNAYGSLLHADWDGWTFTDTIFPFFMWIVGIAITLSTAKRIERGEDRGKLVAHAFRRMVILFAIGLFLNLFPRFDLLNIRIPGVLQRIAVCYFFATLIFLWTKTRGQIVAVALLNAVYWLLMMFYPVPGCGAGLFTKDCNFVRYIDSMLLSGHLYSHTKFWDPEGIVSTLPSIATVLLGVLTGQLLRAVTDPKRRVLQLLGYGAGLAALAQILTIWMPINKNLWTTPFCLWMAGLAMICFAAWYWLADIQGGARWLTPFKIYGMNAIAIYMFSGLVGDILSVSGAGKWIYQNTLLPLASPVNASALYGLLNVLMCYVFAWVLYRKGWFLRF